MVKWKYNPVDTEVDRLIRQKKFRQAEKKLHQALRKHTFNPAAHFNLGIVHFNLQRIDRAIDSFKKVTDLSPDHAEAYRNLATCYFINGDEMSAFLSYLQSFQLDEAHLGTLNNLRLLLARSSVYEHSLLETSFPSLRSLFQILLDSENGNHQALAPAIAKQVLARHRIERDTSANRLLRKLGNDRLFHRFLCECINVNLDLEQCLKKLRKELLLRLCQGSMTNRYLDLMVSIAIQNLNNDYILVISDSEKTLLEELKQKIESSNGELALNISALAMYEHLYTADLNHIELLNDEIHSSSFKRLIQECYLEPQLENRLKASIRRIGSCQNHVSLRVQRQYEEHPFPRWKSLDCSERETLNAQLKALGQNSSKLTISPKSRALIAGCGTGQHPLLIAASNPKCEIKALDLSLTSLAYAKRKAEQFGISNVEFIKGDLLDATELDCVFDHIQAVGVLHHLETPKDGLAALCQILKPGGTMRLGLYSELARQGVVKARKLISEQGISSSSEDIRQFREQILYDEAHKSLKHQLWTLDLFSTSMFRDLVFHECEHRFSVNELERFISSQDLTFLGFEIYREAEVKKAFDLQFDNESAPYDLDCWNQFEKTHPQLFSKMYNFWLKKPYR